MVRDEMGHDFRIGGRTEHEPQRRQFVFQERVVLDDAVVNDDHFAIPPDMRMRVFIGDSAVGCPAGVPDPDVPRHGFLVDEGCQFRHAADLLADQDAVSTLDGDARAVVAAVFESPQAFEKDIGRVARTHVADDSAHVSEPWGTDNASPRRQGRRWMGGVDR